LWWISYWCRICRRWFCGDHKIAAAAFRQLSERTSLSGSQWARGIEARSRALIAGGRDAEDFYLEAIRQLGRSRMTVHLARAHLIYGEWLRRENRRAHARGQLRSAHQMLASMGADGFAERAAHELRATGERVRNRTTDPPAQLTARETQIGRLAGDGLSNRQIAAQLFIAKLTIASRNQLPSALANGLGGAPSRPVTSASSDQAPA
jgi:ATP/maltotriose-dependent transcriptional regulator MalT